MHSGSHDGLYAAQGVERRLPLVKPCANVLTGLTAYITISCMHQFTPPESGSGIVVQAPINVPLPTYDWNAPDQM